MRKMRIFRGVAAIACVFAMASIATADTVNFNFDTTGGGAIFPPSSGSSIAYEIFVDIVDDDGGGRSSQGLQGYELAINTDTGIAQPLPSHSDTNAGAPAAYTYTTIDFTYTGTAKVPYRAGFGMNFLNSTGAVAGDDIVGAGAFGGLEYRADFFGVGPPPLRPSLQWGIGYDTPGTASFVYAPSTGSARADWYLLAGMINVPDAPGVYTVSITPTSVNTITLATDLNADDLDGYVQSELGSSVGGSFSFTVLPEPATMSVLLLAGAGIVLRRRR